MYSYSSLSEYSLFAEYGFVLGMPANKDSVLDVTDRVVEMYEELEEEERELKKDILEANGYWGEYHFIFSEGEVDVSYRLTMALAFYHMRPLNRAAQGQTRLESPRKRSRLQASSVNNGPESKWDFQPFYDLVNGLREEISDENVRLSNASLVKLCEEVQRDSKHALDLLSTHQSANTAMTGFLKTIWEGELWFAEQYLTSKKASKSFR